MPINTFVLRKFSFISDLAVNVLKAKYSIYMQPRILIGILILGINEVIVPAIQALSNRSKNTPIPTPKQKGSDFFIPRVFPFAKDIILFGPGVMDVIIA